MIFHDIITNSTMRKRITSGNMDAEELKQYLTNKLTYPVLVDTLVKYILSEGDDTVEQIAITQDEFDKHFRILGTKKAEDGTLIKENRGRKVGTKVVNGKVVK